MVSAALGRLERDFDAIVASIYRAGAGFESWTVPLKMTADILDSWTIQLLGVNKQTGIVTFSFEAGGAPRIAAVEYLRHWHRVDPRLQKSLPMPPGEWFACEEHIDEAFVANSEFFQDYLIPFGARHVYGTKLHDDESLTVLLGHLTRAGRPPLDVEEKAAFRRIAAHFRKALDIQAMIAPRKASHSVGMKLLEKLHQPMILVDHQRRISFRNESARRLLEGRDIVSDLNGTLACWSAEDDHALTLGLRELVLQQVCAHGDADSPIDRKSLRLHDREGRQVAAALIALRPELTMGAFSGASQALFTLFDPRAHPDVDPGLLIITFGLTPAEARTAVFVVRGHSPDQVAAEIGVKVSTVRTHLSSIFGKTGASGQADLVRLVLSAVAI